MFFQLHGSPLLISKIFSKTGDSAKVYYYSMFKGLSQRNILRDETKCDKIEQLLSQQQQMSQGLAKKPGLSGN